jgi:hypothetical protein
MVLSDIGYTRQTAVPLYVRNSLFEKEGTSLNGDPTQDELAADRRYSHYLGRPFVRFNKPKTPPPHRELPPIEDKKETNGPPPLKTDLTALADFELPDKHKVSFKTLQKDKNGRMVPIDDSLSSLNGEVISVSRNVSVGSDGIDSGSLRSSYGNQSTNISMASMDRSSRKALRRERRFQT